MALSEQARRDRFQEFVAHYTVTMNPSKAYRLCSWTTLKSSSAVSTAAHKLLAEPEVQEEIEAAMEERRKRLEVDADRVVLEQARIAFSDIRNYIEWQDGQIVFKEDSLLDENVSRAVEVLEVTERTYVSGDHSRRTRVKLYSKTAALESLMKHLGLYTERHEVNVNYGTVEVPALANREDWIDVVKQEIDNGDGNTGAPQIDVAPQ